MWNWVLEDKKMEERILWLDVGYCQGLNFVWSSGLKGALLFKITD